MATNYTALQVLAPRSDNITDYVIYRDVVNFFYYVILIPVGFFGNLFTVIVVSYIVRHRQTRRSIPDVCLGLLAFVDLFSVVFIHSISAAAESKNQTSLPIGVCEYQAFVVSLYLKLQFLLQILVCLDRHFALVKPLQYHKFSSFKTMKFLLLSIVLLSIGSTALTYATSFRDVELLRTWTICRFSWDFNGLAEYLVVGATMILICVGLIAFIVCNVALVTVLWHYHRQKTELVWKEISKAVSDLKEGKKKMNYWAGVDNNKNIPATCETKHPNAAVFKSQSSCNSVSQNSGRGDGGEGVGGEEVNMNNKVLHRDFSSQCDSQTRTHSPCCVHQNHDDVMVIKVNGVLSTTHSESKSNSNSNPEMANTVKQGHLDRLTSSSIKPEIDGVVENESRGFITLHNNNNNGISPASSCTNQHFDDDDSVFESNDDFHHHSSKSSHFPKVNITSDYSTQQFGTNNTCIGESLPNSNNDDDIKALSSIGGEGIETPAVDNSDYLHANSSDGKSSVLNSIDLKESIDGCAQVAVDYKSTLQQQRAANCCLITAGEIDDVDLPGEDGKETAKRQCSMPGSLTANDGNQYRDLKQDIYLGAGEGAVVKRDASEGPVASRTDRSMEPEMCDRNSQLGADITVEKSTSQGNGSNYGVRNCRIKMCGSETKQRFGDKYDDNLEIAIPCKQSQTRSAITSHKETGMNNACLGPYEERLSSLSIHKTPTSHLRVSIPAVSIQHSSTSSSQSPGLLLNGSRMCSTTPEIVIDPPSGGSIDTRDVELNTTTFHQPTLTSFHSDNLYLRQKSNESSSLDHFQSQVKKILRKIHKTAYKQQGEIFLARMVLICAAAFLLSWLPYAIVNGLYMLHHTVHPILEDVATRCIFANAVLNPIFYGICRKNYRKGYDYITQAFCHVATFGCIKAPGDDKVFFESRKQKQKRHLEAMEYMKQERKPRKSSAAPAMQILQQTLLIRSRSLRPSDTVSCPHSPARSAPPDFHPSKHLQELFQRYMDESESDESEDETSPIDYEALECDDDQMYQNLKKVLSVYMGLDEMSDACSYGGRDSTGYNTYLDDLDRSEARRLLSISDTNTVKSDTALEDHILHSNNRRHLSLHPHDFIRQHSCPGVRLESDETFL